MVEERGGWFIKNVKDAQWAGNDAFGVACGFDGDTPFPQTGIHIFVFEPGKPNCRYHREEAQEDFLVLSGRAKLLVNGEEHAVKQWDFVHCPAGVTHVFVAEGDAPCALLAIGTGRRASRRSSSTRRASWLRNTTPRRRSRRPIHGSPTPTSGSGSRRTRRRVCSTRRVGTSVVHPSADCPRRQRRVDRARSDLTRVFVGGRRVTGTHVLPDVGALTPPAQHDRAGAARCGHGAAVTGASDSAMAAGRGAPITVTVPALTCSQPA